MVDYAAPAASPLVGREAELEDIARFMGDPLCRLLTLTGPGGIGKTRLAIATAQRQRDEYSVQSCFVPLQPLNSPEFIVSAIAQNLQFPFAADRDLSSQLLEYLEDKALLLVPDNFEHLLEGAHLLSDILGRAPGVKILVTSRERLNLVEEWVYEVGGLSLPSDMPDADFERCGAVQLFVQNARRAHHSFALTQENRSAVSRICRLVGGMPLAIEMASAWAHVLSCAVVADEIERSLDILESSVRNLAPRHRTMRAVFEPTWNRLAEEERAVFARLSVFRGSFALEAAEQIAGASHPVLRALADKSLIRMVGAGRYAVHELLRQYGEEHLKRSPRMHEYTLDTHREYYMSFLGEREKQMVFLGRQKEACAKMSEELENLRLAWQRTVEQECFAEIAAGGEGLWGFY